jgi:cytochrome-b5 reductase
MSQHLESLKVGDSLLMKGPKGHMEYHGKGEFTIVHKRVATRHRKKKLGMVCGGTGITPMLQVIRAILRDPEDTTELWLMFGNQTEEDILLRKELETIPSNRLHLFYTLDRPPSFWKHGVGFVTEEMCRKNLPPAGPDSMIFMCGPPLMMSSIQGHLKNLGMTEADFFTF